MKPFTTFLLLAALTLAGAAEFTAFQPQQSSITFVSRQMGVPVEGSFRRFNANFAVDPEMPEQGKGSIDINVDSIDVVSQEAYEEVTGRSWFDIARYPKASFVSSKVSRIAAGRYEVTGKLTIRNVTRELKAPFTLEQKGAMLVIDGAFPLKRLDYGIGSGEWGDTDTVADEVQIRFHFIVANKK